MISFAILYGESVFAFDDTFGAAEKKTSRVVSDGKFDLVGTSRRMESRRLFPVPAHFIIIIGKN